MSARGGSAALERAIAAGEGDDASVERGIWRHAIADRMAVIIDGEDYFAHVHTAMYNARKQIVLIGWDFDTRIKLARGNGADGLNGECPLRLGDCLTWLVERKRGLDIRLLKWGLSWVQFLLRGRMAWDIARMWRVDGINLRFDTNHPPGCSHHQKVIVFDRRLAVAGGIDLTFDRWDTRLHLEEDPRRVDRPGHLSRPWHDMSVMMEGPIARALFDLCDVRWQLSGGDPLDRPEPPGESLWPERLPVDFEDVEIGLSRTRTQHGAATEVREVEELFLAHIARARRFIYIENQYFTARTIAEAIAARLGEPDPPEIVIVHPRHADGWVEQQAMDHARDLVAEAVELADARDRFEVYVPFSGETPVYVHAKLMIVDDEVLRIGSANLNNRSLGLDSECDTVLDTLRPHNSGRGLEEAIRAIRVSLLAEHCGVEERAMDDALREHGTMQRAIAALGSTGRRQLRAYVPPSKSEFEQWLAESAMLDPERPSGILRPFAQGGLFGKGGRLRRLRARAKRKLSNEQSGGSGRGS